MGRNDGKKAEKVLKILQGKEKKYQSEYSENAKASENASRADYGSSNSTPPKPNRKRSGSAYDDSDSDEGNRDDIGNEMTSLIHKFGTDMKKTISAKRKKLESLTAQSATNCTQRVDKILDNQKRDREKLNTEYEKQVKTLFAQWETDIARVKENEEKFNSVLQQQVKLLSQVRVIHSQRLKSLKQIHEQYIQSHNQMENSHKKQSGDVTTEVNEELKQLQAKILKHNQAEEMASMRKNLNTMLFR